MNVKLSAAGESVRGVRELVMTVFIVITHNIVVISVLTVITAVDTVILIITAMTVMIFMTMS